MFFLPITLNIEGLLGLLYLCRYGIGGDGFPVRVLRDGAMKFLEDLPGDETPKEFLGI